MAYPNYYNTYPQPPYYQPPMQDQLAQLRNQYQPSVMTNTPQNPMIWVQGEAGAKSYLMAPNTTLPLWDSENQTIYIKSTDASGMPLPLRILDYTERTLPPKAAPAAVTPSVEYVPRQEFDNLKAEFDALAMNLRQQSNNQAKENEDHGKSTI